eukprot:g10289.t1
MVGQVMCHSRSMWECLDANVIQDKHDRSKCLQFKLLQLRVSELEVAQWLALLPHSARDPGSIPASVCVEFAHSPRVCVGFLQVLQF